MGQMGKMTQFEMSMSYKDDIEIAKRKLLQAERALEDYFRGPVLDIELAKQLIDAETVARDEFLDRLAHHWYPTNNLFPR